MPRIAPPSAVEPANVTYTSQTKSVPVSKLASSCFSDLSDNEAGDECWRLIGGGDGILQIARKADEAVRAVELLLREQVAGIDASDQAWFAKSALEIAASIDAAFFEYSMKRKQHRIAMLHALRICQTYVEIVFRVWAMSEIVQSDRLAKLKENLEALE